MISLEPIEQALLAFFARSANVPAAFTVDTDLLAEIDLDSMLVTDLLLFIESTFQVTLAARDVSPDNLRSIRRLGAVVAAKQEKLRKAA
jgi:acyl carrier protein